MILSLAGKSGRFGFALLAGSVLIGYLLWPTFWISIHNPEPEVLTVAEYLAHGSKREWIVLKDCYVPGSGKIETVMEKSGQRVGPGYTYYPIRTGPQDTGPVKIFVRPSKSGSSNGNQVRLARRDGEFYTLPDRDDDARQEVAGVLLIGPQYERDVKEILTSPKSNGAPDAVILDHNQTPPGLGTGIAALVGPIVGLIVSILILAWPRRLADLPR